MTYYTKPVSKARAEIIRTAQQNRQAKINQQKTQERYDREFEQDLVDIDKEYKL